MRDNGDFSTLDDSMLLRWRAEMRAELERLPPGSPLTPRSPCGTTGQPRKPVTALGGPGSGRMRCGPDSEPGKSERQLNLARGNPGVIMMRASTPARERVARGRRR